MCMSSAEIVRRLTGDEERESAGASVARAPSGNARPSGRPRRHPVEDDIEHGLGELFTRPTGTDRHMQQRPDG
ncbi:hypothetical protein BH20CHL3_BH20CHL3_03030 [soil metagenome]